MGARRSSRRVRAHLSLRASFRLGAIIATLVLLVPLALIMAKATGTVHSAREGQRAYDVLAAALHAAQDVATERRPGNGAMAAPLPLAPDLAAQLTQARQDTDHDLAVLQHAMRTAGADAADATSLQQARDTLRAGRAAVDTLLARQLGERFSDDVEHAIDTMVGVVPHLLAIAASSLSGVPADAAGPLRSAILAANLREQAGLLGARLTPAYVTGRALNDAEQAQIEVSEGRIEQIVMLLDQEQDVDSARDIRAQTGLDSAYLTHGRQVFDLARAAMTGRPATDTAADFAAAYVPTMQSIVDFRDAMLACGSRDVAVLADHARRDLLLANAGSLLLILSAITLAWGYERRIIAPIGTAANAILDLVGKDDSDTGQHEVAALKRAVAALTDHADAQASRVRSLEAAANTDALTGALNSRALRDEFARWQASGRQRHQAFVVLDIDHFKRINDTHGHPAGDEVLRDLVSLATATFRGNDLIARVGGEEFAILMKVDAPGDATAVAERFRRLVASTPIMLPTGETITYTVSIGVSVASAAHAPDFDALFLHADQLLYKAKNNGRNRVEDARLPTAHGDEDTIATLAP